MQIIESAHDSVLRSAYAASQIEIHQSVQLYKRRPRDQQFAPGKLCCAYEFRDQQPRAPRQ